jgi:hypothetical protein
MYIVSLKVSLGLTFSIAMRKIRSSGLRIKETSSVERVTCCDRFEERPDLEPLQQIEVLLLSFLQLCRKGKEIRDQA